MNFIERVLIEKAGHENGFENVLTSEKELVLLGSARHRAQAIVTKSENKLWLKITSTVSPQLPAELARSFPTTPRQDNKLLAVDIAELAILMRRAAKLAQALPCQPVSNFERQVKEEQAKYAADTLKNTEIERLVKQRIGQNIFRNAMLDYWGGACAVTGIAIPEVLRASHAKPWKDCNSDAERLDVFNGFLLSANLDALFDRNLISFDQNGKILISPQLNQDQCKLLGLHPDLHLRWLANQHLFYLDYHRHLLGAIK
jgi:putative restriction endonuclease